MAVQELVLPGVRCLMPQGTERQCWMRRLATPASRRWPAGAVVGDCARVEIYKHTFLSCESESLESVDIHLDRYETRNHKQAHETMIMVFKDKGTVLAY